MIELLRIKIQHLNGENVIRQEKLPTNRTFQSMEAMEDFRRLKQLKAQWKADKRKEQVQISVLFEYKTKES